MSITDFVVAALALACLVFTITETVKMERHYHEFRDAMTAKRKGKHDIQGTSIGTDANGSISHRT
jgi:hypothetical protein